MLDSWSVWDEAAGGAAYGRPWRQAYLRRTYNTTSYRPYEVIVAEAAAETGLAPEAADRLVQRWGGLRPWPEVPAVLGLLAPYVRLGVFTNCSRALGLQAAEATGGAFDAVVTAEEARAYKPAPEAYRAALRPLATPPERVLYVAGSPYDVAGAAAMGMTVYWHDRIGLAASPDHAGAGAAATWVHDSLQPLLEVLHLAHPPGTE